MFKFYPQVTTPELIIPGVYSCKLNEINDVRFLFDFECSALYNVMWDQVRTQSENLGQNFGGNKCAAKLGDRLYKGIWYHKCVGYIIYVYNETWTEIKYKV